MLFDPAHAEKQRGDAENGYPCAALKLHADDDDQRDAGDDRAEGVYRRLELPVRPLQALPVEEHTELT